MTASLRDSNGFTPSTPEQPRDPPPHDTQPSAAELNGALIRADWALPALADAAVGPVPEQIEHQGAGPVRALVDGHPEARARLDVHATDDRAARHSVEVGRARDVKDDVGAVEGARGGAAARARRR